MSRYIGPVCRLCRRETIKLMLKGSRCYSAKCRMERQNRNRPPGMHFWRRGKSTPYSVRLREKQKVKRYYGVLERQFARYFRQAERARGNTGEVLLSLLERRLDNVVYRMGFAASRNEARQLVRHNGITVNGRKLNIPSYQVRPDDQVAVSEGTRQHLRVQSSVEMSQQRGIPDWLDVDAKAMKGVFKSVPERSELPPEINENLVVELYSK